MTLDERLKKIATAFDASEASDYFVSLSKTKNNLTELTDALSQKYKMLLVYGPSGTGKTYTLRRFFDENKEAHTIFFYSSPSFDLRNLSQIYEYLSGEKLIDPTHSELSDKLKAQNQEFTIILDEAQLYSNEQLEFIRLLSDEPFCKVILSTNEHKEDSIIKTKQFESRIYKYINFENLEETSLKHFVEEKLLLVEASNYFASFNAKSFQLLSRFTLGNIRDINRVLNRAFILLASNLNDSLNIGTKELNKYIEMAAIDLELVKNKKFFGLTW